MCFSLADYTGNCELLKALQHAYSVITNAKAVVFRVIWPI